MNYRVVAKSVPGVVLKENQDAALVRHGMLNNREILLAAVCDGVGSLENSSEASSRVIGDLNEWFKRYVETGEDNSTKEILNQLTEVITNSNSELFKLKQKGKKLGTTVTAVFINAKEKCYVHVGDTRLYGLNSDLKQITRDDTLVEMQVQSGIISKKEALESNCRHVLLKCVGATENIDITGNEIKEEFEAFLLCSDGLRNHLKENEIKLGMCKGAGTEEQDMEKILGDWINTVIARGERDNITGILISKVLDATEVLDE